MMKSTPPSHQRFPVTSTAEHHGDHYTPLTSLTNGNGSHKDDDEDGEVDEIAPPRMDIHMVGATGIPKNLTLAVPAASAAVRARLATYGPRNTVPTVVLKAELAQSYIAQPKISLLSFTIVVSAVMIPP
ncbi:MAG: hypothetical protein P8Y68_14360 [Anaerolineales bacterium]